MVSQGYDQGEDDDVDDDDDHDHDIDVGSSLQLLPYLRSRQYRGGIGGYNITCDLRKSVKLVKSRDREGWQKTVCPKHLLSLFC